MRICIIEDDSSSMIAESLLIKKLRPDVRLEQFMSDALAIRHYSSHPMPHILFLDYWLGGTTGGELLAWFRNQGFKGQAYFVTADYMQVPPEDVAIANGIIFKPCITDDFKEVLK